MCGAVSVDAAVVSTLLLSDLTTGQSCWQQRAAMTGVVNSSHHACHKHLCFRFQELTKVTLGHKLLQHSKSMVSVTLARSNRRLNVEVMCTAALTHEGCQRLAHL